MRAAIVVLVGVLGCTSGSPLSPGRADGGPGGNGADGSVDSGALDQVAGDTGVPACGGLGACDCLANGGCVPIATSPWCPDCGGGPCIAGGGSFIACQPASCPAASCGLGALGPPDQNGCRGCDVAPTCAGAVARVQAACGPTYQLSADAVTGLCMGTGPSCVAGCLANLTSCDQIPPVNCSYCQTCDCSPVRSPLLDCVQLCMAR